jgi:FKBP-type peptidyl-prolyl cis-trans isomerase FkpA
MRIRTTLLALSVLLLAAPTVRADDAAPAAPAASSPELSTDAQKAAYAIGYALYRNLATFDLTPDELAIVEHAMSDAAAGKTPVVTLEEARPMIEAMRKERMEKKLAEEKVAGAKLIEAAAAEPGAVKTESGMVYLETRAGTGESPQPDDMVKVNYRGTLADGTEFDSSYKRNQPAEFALNRVIKCWTEGLARMKAGGKAKLVCPADLAYGDRGRPMIAPGATLTFEVELLEVTHKPAVTTPPDPHDPHQ